MAEELSGAACSGTPTSAARGARRSRARPRAPRALCAAVALVGGLLVAIGAPDAAAIDLGTLGGAGSGATALNASGQVVGFAETASGAQHAFLWTAQAGMIDLGTLGGEDSSATLITPTGQVAGTSQTASGATHAFSWTQAKGMVDLGTLGGEESRPAAVNANGQVVGGSLTSTGARHAFSWNKTKGMVDLGTLGGAESSAEGVNSSGEVVGRSITGLGAEEAFTWTKAAGMTGLGGGATDAQAINDTGQVVGRAFAGEQPRVAQAFSWTKSGGFVYLGEQGQGATASALNASGEAIGAVEVGHGVSGFLWGPPASATFMGHVPECCGSAPTALNGAGEVVGSSGAHGFSWSAGREISDLGPGLASGVNEASEVSGSAAEEGVSHAALWNTAAGPAWGRCAKAERIKEGGKTTYEGAFTTAACTEASEGHNGRFEWDGGVFGTRFGLALRSATVTLETSAKVKVTCTSAAGHGFYAGIREVEGVALELGGCEAAGQPCTSPGASSGSIVAATLEGTLGWEEQAAHRVALELAPSGGAPFAEYSCAAGSSETVTGAVLVPVAADRMLRAATLRYRQSAGAQKPESFEGGPPEVLSASLNGEAPQPLGLGGTFALAGEEPVEVGASGQ